MSKHRLKVRLRAFAIWQKLGFMPWSKSRSRSRKGDFYKGAFDTLQKYINTAEEKDRAGAVNASP